MGKLTTHVLDTAAGRPAAGVEVRLFSIREGDRHAIGGATTNDDGRCDAPLLADEAFVDGVYELEFAVGDYFAGDTSEPHAAPRFLDRVVIRFGVNRAAEHYHVPLLISPHAYSTYRGS